MAKIVMGLDVGFVNMGCVAFELNVGGGLDLKDCCVISTEKSNAKLNIRQADDDVRRSRELTKGLVSFYQNNVGMSDKVLVVTEFPHGGAQGARPNRTMGMATGIVATFIEIFQDLNDNVTPQQTKIGMTGMKSASKKEVMDNAVLFLCGDPKMKTNNRGKTEWYYYVDQKVFREDVFEHIADAVGAVVYSRDNSDLYRLFLGA